MKNKKWWVAFANNKKQVDIGAYEGLNCRSRRHALTTAKKLIIGGLPVVYVVKYQRTYAAVTQ
ncbi:hypothetical protein [Methylotenera sp.]|uniref:hypothetical protein n=1 Tax=Methylotenera sp. TaxID=2051956 RepID=UPI002ED8D533